MRVHADNGGRKAGGAALFSRSGAHIFLAAMGAVAVLDASSLDILQSLQARPLATWVPDRARKS